nr:MAG: putative symptom severity modulator [Tombusvirus sp.]
MERAVQRSNVGKQITGECRVGGCGSTITPFQLPDESPNWFEWRFHHCEENPDKDHPLGFKESWSFGPVIFKRYLRYDWKKASLHRVLGSWTRDSVNIAASRLLGVNPVGCTYCIRIRGVSVTVSGGSGSLQRLIEMAIRLKFTELQSATNEVEGFVSRGCPKAGTEACSKEESELDRLFSESMKLKS